jgi:hypothetical protein
MLRAFHLPGLSLVLRCADFALHAVSHRGFFATFSQRKNRYNLLFLLAEAQGFEPWNPFRLPVFKTGAIDHSAKLPV